MKRALAVTAAGVLSLAVTQNASAREFADIYTDCGLGAMIAPNNDAVAAVTNVTWDLGTTAVLSEASTQDACKGGKERTAAFIYHAYPQLEKDLAQGYGEHLNVLLSIAGCTNQASVVSALRQDLSAAASDPSYSSQSRYEQAEGLHNRLYERIEHDYPQACAAANATAG